MQTHRDGDFQRIYRMKHSVHANFLTLLTTWKTTFILRSLTISNFEGYRGKEKSLVAHWICTQNISQLGQQQSTCTSPAASKSAGITQGRQIKETLLTAIQNNALCSQGNEPERESKHRPSQSNMGLDQENTPG